jgi:hypothetical protein
MARTRQAARGSIWNRAAHEKRAGRCHPALSFGEDASKGTENIALHHSLRKCKMSLALAFLVETSINVIVE